MSEKRESKRSLGDELPEQTARVRELTKAYREIGPAGIFALRLMEDALRRADRAMIEGDVVAMVRCYEELKDFE